MVTSFVKFSCPIINIMLNKNSNKNLPSKYNPLESSPFELYSLTLAEN